jgi:hypothetical protein
VGVSLIGILDGGGFFCGECGLWERYQCCMDLGLGFPFRSFHNAMAFSCLMLGRVGELLDDG